jgi:hypothetical protein
MGTSHRHIPGVTGEPNWGKSSQDVTRISKVVEEEKELEQNPQNISQKDIEKRQRTLNKRKSRIYRNAVRNLVRAAGGRSFVSSGGSHAVGGAGVNWAISWTNAFQEIAEQGLSSWLQNRGQSLEGKSCQDIIILIEKFIGDYFVGLDDTAAKEALSHVLELIEDKLNDNIKDFDKVFNEILYTEEIKDLVDQFFGIYIYSYLSQNFYEKIEKSKGTEIANETMLEIKELILDDVSRGINGRPAGQVDWKGEEGNLFIKSEFDRIIKIITDNED